MKNVRVLFYPFDCPNTKGVMKEIIEHNNKKIVKTTKKNGDISYTIKGVYIGTDVKTNKRITKTITARTLKILDRKIVEAKIS